MPDNQEASPLMRQRSAMIAAVRPHIFRILNVPAERISTQPVKMTMPMEDRMKLLCSAMRFDSVMICEVTSECAAVKLDDSGARIKLAEKFTTIGDSYLSHEKIRRLYDIEGKEIIDAEQVEALIKAPARTISQPWSALADFERLRNTLVSL